MTPAMEKALFEQLGTLTETVLKHNEVIQKQGAVIEMLVTTVKRLNAPNMAASIIGQVLGEIAFEAEAPEERLEQMLARIAEPRLAVTARSDLPPEDTRAIAALMEEVREMAEGHLAIAMNPTLLK